MNVVFEEEKVAPISTLPRSTFIEWLIENHIVRTYAQGQMLAIGLVVVFLIGACVVWTRSRDTGPVDTQKNFVPAVVGR